MRTQRIPNVLLGLIALCIIATIELRRVKNRCFARPVFGVNQQLPGINRRNQAKTLTLDELENGYIIPLQFLGADLHTPGPGMKITTGKVDGRQAVVAESSGAGIGGLHFKHDESICAKKTGPGYFQGLAHESRIAVCRPGRLHAIGRGDHRIERAGDNQLTCRIVFKVAMLAPQLILLL